MTQFASVPNLPPMPKGISGNYTDVVGVERSEYVRAQEIAARTGLHVKTVQRRLRRDDYWGGVVPVIRVGTRMNVLPRAKFEAFLAGDLPPAAEAS